MDMTDAQLEFLAGGRAAEFLEMDLPTDELRALGLLRRSCSPEESRAIIALRGLRKRAAGSGRFPQDLARQMLATDKLLQQASSMRLAIWKGRRFAEMLGTSPAGVVDAAKPLPEVWDLCCGLGGDAIGLALAGMRVRGVDSDPAAVLCATHNARAAGVGELCRFDLANVEQLDVPAEAVVHIDPDRRASGRRSIEFAHFSPGEAFLAHLARRTAAGAMKLPPGADAAELESIQAGLFEYVSEAGVCKQLVAWWHAEQTSSEDRPRRCATVLAGPLDDPQSTSIEAGVAPYAPIREPGEWLVEPDPALVAAEAVDDLAATEDLWRIAIGLPWLFGDRAVSTPLASCFEVLADVPGRKRDIAKAVSKLGGGCVEVKTRGVKLDTDSLQRQLRGRGDKPLAVLWCRQGPRQRAFICRRVAH